MIAQLAGDRSVAERVREVLFKAVLSSGRPRPIRTTLFWVQSRRALVKLIRVDPFRDKVSAGFT